MSKTKKIIAAAFILSAFAFTAFSEYELRLVKVEAQACDRPDCG